MEQNYPIEDTAFKVAGQFFGDELLPQFGIKGSLRYAVPTESIQLDIHRMYQDFNYFMEDGTLLHLEFESDAITTEDLRRFRQYEATLSRTYKTEVNTYVVCSAKTKNPMNKLKCGFNIYRVKVVRLKNEDADEVFRKVLSKQKKGRALTRGDLLRTVLTPLMSGRCSVKERILNTCRVLKQEEVRLTKEDLDQLQAVMYAFAVKFLNKADLDEVKEALRMTILGEMIWNDGFQGGFKDGFQGGFKDGFRGGELQQLISLICKKLRKGQDTCQIADAVEEDFSYVEEICETAKKYAPDYDAEKVYKEIQSKTEKVILQETE